MPTVTKAEWLTAFATELRAQTGNPLRSCQRVAQTWYGVLADAEPSQAVDRWMLENMPAPAAPAAPRAAPEQAMHRDSRADNRAERATYYEEVIGAALRRPVTEKKVDK